MKLVLRTAVGTCIFLYFGFSILTGWWPRYGCVDMGQGQSCGIQLGGTADLSFIVWLAALVVILGWCLFASNKAPSDNAVSQPPKH
jgi:hypothetical protein